MRAAPPRAHLDVESLRWLTELRRDHPRHDAAVSRLLGILRRGATRELRRRRSQLGSVHGPELEDLAHQAADDALVSILARLDDFQGRSRFTTWAYKFVVFEASAKVASHAWRRHPPDHDGLTLERLPDLGTAAPQEHAEQRGRLDVLSVAIGELSERQRVVFVSVALNDAPIDDIALKLGSNRNAVYKNLFDARRSLRGKLAAAGYPVDGDG